ncbi:hypothetical protein BDD12DRAFT_761254 [Trichophaea hybrida]|nr:hypothetical protein BDD12DRAFT_761254 [Trichophaea hybrida]
MSPASSTPTNSDPNDKYAFSDDNSESSILLNPAAEALLDRSTALLEEVESFQRSLRHTGLEKTVELRLFLNQVKSEHRCLQGLTLECPDSTKSRHGVHASNLPYLEAVWGHAKKTMGITALCKSFSYAEPGVQNTRGKKKKLSVTVDIVAQNGLQWIKVSLLTPRRLLFELAKAGWEEAADFSDNEDAPSSLDPATTLATSSTSLSNLADNLLIAARQTRVQYLHPTITFILPHLPPTTPEVTTFLTSLQAKGITISTPTTLLPAPGIEDLVSTLTSPLSRRAIPLSSPLNIDTTILLALISDISHHVSVEVEPRMHPAILRQLDMEKERPMLPGHLLPVLEGRDMICCVSARERFEEIVDIVASDTERERAQLLLSYPSSSSNITPEDRIKRLQELSTHPCSTLKLPIVTVPDHTLTSTDPPEFRQVSGKLSSVNRGAFMTGWARGVTTVTSNRAVAKMVEAACSGGEVVGPDVFVVESARSLVGKGKTICDVVGGETER